MDVSGLLPLLWLARLPCLPVELGSIPTTPEAPPPPPPAVAPLPPPPAPPPPPLPAPLSMRELARYRIDYGVLSIGELSLSIDGRRSGADGALVRAAGHGQGSIFGLGRLENHVDAEFDAVRLASRRWSSARLRDGGAVRDVGEQPRQGQLDLIRERDGRPPQRHLATTAGAALDPVGFLLRVRVAPPAPGGPPQVLQMLDGQALWRVTLANAGRELLGEGAAAVPAVRLEGRAEPIHYDGTLDDGDRPRREFVLWLSEDPAHVPLRLEMPVGIADLVVALVELERNPI